MQVELSVLILEEIIVLQWVLVLHMMEQVQQKKDPQLVQRILNAKQLNQQLVIHALKMLLRNAKHKFVLIMMPVLQIVLIMLTAVSIILINVLLRILVQIIIHKVVIIQPNKHGVKEYRIYQEISVLGMLQIPNVKTEHVVISHSIQISIAKVILNPARQTELDVLHKLLHVLHLMVQQIFAITY